jgi:hypothetical protein
MTKNGKKLTAGKKIIYSYFFKSKIEIYLFLGLRKGPTSYRKSSALKREHPALQNMKFLNFFLFFWVNFALLDLDPDFESGSGYGSTELIQSGSERLRVTCTGTCRSNFFSSDNLNVGSGLSVV